MFMNDGGGFVMGGFMWIIWLVPIILIIFAVKFFSDQSGRTNTTDTPLDILKKSVRISQTKCRVDRFVVLHAGNNLFSRRERCRLYHCKQFQQAIHLQRKKRKNRLAALLRFLDL